MADAYDYLESQVDNASQVATALPPPPATIGEDGTVPEEAGRESRRHKSNREHKSGRDKSRSRSRERRRGYRSSEKDKDTRREKERDFERESNRTRPFNNGGGRGRHNDDRRQPGRDVPRDNYKRFQRPPSPIKQRERTPPEVAAQRNNEKDLRDMERSARTVFAYNLSLKAEDRDIFQLFSRAGTVLDVKLITDRSTRRSKGFAYIEYEDQTGVLAALGLTGQLLMGQPVMVKSAEAEKNLAWEVQQNAAQQQANQAAAGSLITSFENSTTRLVVGNLNPQLGEADLHEVFRQYGTLESVTLVRGADGQSAGQAYVQYVDPTAAALVLKTMDGLNVAGHSIQVSAAPLAPSYALMGLSGLGQPGLVPTLQLPQSLLGGGGLGPQLTVPAGFGVQMALFGAAPLPGPPPMPTGGLDPAAAAGIADAYSGSIGDLDEDEGGGSGRGGLKMNASARAALMSRLASSAGLAPPSTAMPLAAVPQHSLPAAPAPAGPRVDPNLTLLQGLLGPSSPIPTTCLLLKNMFSAAEESGADWDLEIAGDVKDECSKYGPVVHVWVDKNSQGFVYVKFASGASAEAAQRNLHGRYFAGKQIAAEYQFVAAYSHFFKV